MNTYFYLRVSTKEKDKAKAEKDREQTFDRQKGILERSGYTITDENTFAERISGKTKADEREQFETMLALLEPNDWVIFTETSRFSRSYILGMQMLDILVFDKKVNVKFVSNGIELLAGEKYNPYTWFTVSQMLLADELQRRVIGYNTANGLQRIRELGVKTLGRPSSLNDTIKKDIIEDRTNGMAVKDIVAKYNITKPTMTKVLKEAGLVREYNRVQ